MSSAGPSKVIVSVARKLVHNDKAVRDQALALLCDWLQKKTDMDLGSAKKIWKALFYCMWMSDKLHVQQELARNLAAMLSAFRPETAVLWAEAFYAIMIREWSGIDRLRLDKYYYLLTRFLEQSALYLSRHDWEPSLVQQWADMLGRGPFKPNQLTSKGIVYNCIASYLSSLQAAAPNSSATLLMCLQPVAYLFAHTTDKTLLRRIETKVWTPIRTPWASLIRLASGQADEQQQDEDDQEYSSEDEDGNEDGILVDPEDVADMLFKLAADASSRNTVALYRLKKRFVKLHKQVQDCGLRSMLVSEDQDESSEEQEQPLVTAPAGPARVSPTTSSDTSSSEVEEEEEAITTPPKQSKSSKQPVTPKSILKDKPKLHGKTRHNKKLKWGKDKTILFSSEESPIVVRRAVQRAHVQSSGNTLQRVATPLPGKSTMSRILGLRSTVPQPSFAAGAPLGGKGNTKKQAKAKARQQRQQQAAQKRAQGGSAATQGSSPTSTSPRKKKRNRKGK